MTFALAFTLLGAAALTTAMQRGAIPSRPQGPCDIYGDAGTPCAAAHSTTRALYASYNGPLYQVTRQSDGRPLDIGVVAPVASPVPDAGGYADAAAQDAFCTGTLCVISQIFDQSGKGNHLYQAPPGPLFPGPAKGGFDTEPIADMAPMTIGGHKAYGVYVMPGMGFRNNDATGLAIGDEPEGIYYVIDGSHYDSGCCFDYGNASTNGRAVGTGTMETTYFGTSTAWGRGSGPGPWIMADMEAGLFSGYDAKQNAATPTIDAWRFVTAVVDGGGGNKWDLRGGNAQHGGLTTFYSGVRPGTPASDAYYPMHKQGAILLGIGGDNGNGSSGTFYEGVMTTGYPGTATTDAVQANIVAARYDVLPVSLSRVTTFTPGSAQQITATFTNTTGAIVQGAAVRLALPAGWLARAPGSAGAAVTFREPIAPGASASATFTVTAPTATGAGFVTATAQWTSGRGKAVETTTARVRNVLPIKINEVRLGPGPGVNPTDQFVELYNASASAVDLSGWTLINTPSQWAPVTLATIPAGTTLAPGAFYLLGLSSAGLAAPADRGATAIHVRSTTGLAAGQTIDIDGEPRTAVSIGTAATAMTTVFVPVSTGPWIAIPAGATNLPVTNAAGFTVGQPIGIDVGGAYEQATVTAVGKAATQTTLSAAAVAGATSIAVAAGDNISAGDTLTIGTGGRKERATVAAVGAGITLATPLTRDHAAGVDVSDVGTGISFSPATRLPHRSGDAVQALGGGITLDRPLANNHGYGAPVRDPRVATEGYQGPAPGQWFGGVLSARGGSIALLDPTGAVIVDAIVYGSQQSNSSGNGTIASPHLATLEADQGKGGCIAVVPAAGRGGPGAATAAALDRSLGRFPDGFDADHLCTDFLLQPATTMLAASTAGAATIKVASVTDFTAGQTIALDTGVNVETAVVATVGTPGATTAGSATEVGATVVPVASAVGFSAGQTITIDIGANEETAVVAAAAGGRGGARITIIAPLTRAHAAGTQVSGSGITLTAALTRPHAPGTAVATDPPTPGAPNRYSNRPVPTSPPAKPSTAQASGDRWWTGYGNGPDNSRYFEARQIDKANVGQLRVAWTYPFGDTGSSPIVVRGVAYGRGRNGSLVAVNAQTGQELWIRERMNGMTSRGINYWESPDGRDQRLIFSMDSLLQEVDARTGTSIQSFGTNGVVDLRVGIDGRDPETIGPIQSNTPGEIFENLLILGSATGEGYMSPPGDIRAYDVLTGRLVWTFHTVPRPGEYGYDTWPKDAWKYVGGTNNWGEMTIDTARGIAYVPIGSPTYDFYGADRAGANLFGTSIVALDARTGRRRWHFQLVHHDLWDMDPSAAPQLTTIRQSGRNRDVVAITAKTGWLYVFDRVTGEPIWPIEERPVPKSTMEGEQSWPTQPVPTKPAAYIKHTFTVDDINPDLPAEQAAALKSRLLASANGGIFTPLGTTDTVSVPASNGGTLFGGAAAEPRTGAVYVVAHDNPGIVRLLRPGQGRGFGGPPVSPGQIVYEQNCQMCHGVNRQGTDTGVPLVHAAADPANGIAAGASRFAGAAIRAVLATGKNRMPPFPHLSAADVDNLVSLLTTAAGGRGRGSFPGRGPSAAGSGAPPELIAGSGSAWVRPDSPGVRGRGAVPYPDGTPDYTRYTINEYHTVANGIRPPFTTIVKFDLNAPAVRWRIPFGDDPALALRGISGTGAPATNNGIILTASGLVFGAGLDNHIRAWDGDSGRELWAARFGGNFTGSPVMYVMGGKQYLLVAAASTPARRGGADPAAPVGPTGWVAYALPR